MHLGLGSGMDWFLSDPDLLGLRLLDPTRYFKNFKYKMSPDI